jgi:hypothetical protein
VQQQLPPQPAILLSKSGFRLDLVVATKSPFSVIEAVPV